MSHRLTSLALASFALAAAACSGSTTTTINAPATLTVRDDSSFALIELRVAPVDQVDWGPNLLPSELLPGDTVQVDLACDTYDVLVTDEAGRMCTLGNLDMCFSDNVWVVDDQTLANCGF